MRRFTFITLVVLFLLIVIAAVFKWNGGREGRRPGPGVTLTPTPSPSASP